MEVEETPQHLKSKTTDYSGVSNEGHIESRHCRGLNHYYFLEVIIISS